MKTSLILWPAPAKARERVFEAAAGRGDAEPTGGVVLAFAGTAAPQCSGAAPAVDPPPPAGNQVLDHQLDAPQGVLYLQPHGPLTAADFQQVAAEVDPLIAEHHDLKGLMITADKFPGWSDFGTFAAHLRFVRDHHEHIRRVAIVSDDQLLTALPKLATHFVAAEVKHFASTERAAADAWLRDAG